MGAGNESSRNTSSILTRLTSPAAYTPSSSLAVLSATRTSTSSSIDLDAGSPSPAAFYHFIRHMSVSRLDRLVGREQRPCRCYRPMLMCHAASAPTMFYTLTGLFVVFSCPVCCLSLFQSFPPKRWTWFVCLSLGLFGCLS